MALIRLLLWCVVGWLAYQGIRALGRGNRPGAAVPPAAPSEDMVRCRACQLNLPRSEAIAIDGQWACCAEHARRGAPAARP